MDFYRLSLQSNFMLGQDFFQRDVLTVARELIGVELVWRGCSGVIVETEAYAAEGDEACHTMSRPSARAFVQDHPAGAAYVYFNYGMYWMLNILVKGGSCDGLILIRAIEPVNGLPLMHERRRVEKLQQLCSGPGKLAIAFGVTGSDHGLPLAGTRRPLDCGLKKQKQDSCLDVVADIRVGISKAANYPWRFLAKGNPHVSVPFGKVKTHKPSMRKIKRPG